MPPRVVVVLGKAGILLELHDWGCLAQKNGMFPGEKKQPGFNVRVVNVWMKVFLRMRANPGALQNPACRWIDLSAHWRSWAWLGAPRLSPLSALLSFLLTTSRILPPAVFEW